MNLNSESRTLASWLCRALSGVFILAFVTSAFAQTPTLRANGKIAFVTANDPHAEQYRSGISVMNPDGSGRTQLTTTQILCPPPNGAPGSCGPDHFDYSPSWSPDGKQIAFIRSGPSAGDVFVMNADGSNQRRLTQVETGGWADHPTWSPDGTKLAFAGLSIDHRSVQVYVMNADGSNKHPVGPGQNPAWSPDGSKLAFPFNSLDSDSGIHVMNPDGSGRTKITTPRKPGPGSPWDSDWAPVWSPDGLRILFVRYVGCAEDNGCESITVWTVNADGSNLAKVADSGAADLAWSPDGTKLVFRWLGGDDDDRNGDLFTMNADGSYDTRLTNTPDEYESMPSWQSVALAPADNNPIDDTQFFVRQHYKDFLNRDADPDGLAFWTGQITSCGADENCMEVRRITDSGSFFLSIEFQETGYLVYRLYKVAYGDLPGAPVPVSFSEFMPDTQTIGRNVIVKQAGWEQVLENNKRALVADFVQRTRFTAAFVPSMSASEFVDRLNLNAGNPLSPTERNQLASDLLAGTRSRAEVLRAVAEHPNVAGSEFNRAFVLMQYFGYLRRNPNDAPDGNFNGYNFWLNKLNQFNGDFAGAEMVRAFLVSTEYRHRFGP